jgi:hypothetical protein
MKEKISFGAILLDPDNPNSLFQMVPKATWEAFARVPPQYLAMTAKELRHTIKNVGLTLEALRVSFWAEYNSALLVPRTMSIARVYAGICSDEYFYREVLHTPLLMAWLLCPPESYQKALETLLARSTERMYEMVNQEYAFPNSKGEMKADPRVMSIIFNIHKHLEDRVKGTVVQQIEQRNLNVNINKQLESVSEDELERKIKELRARERKAIGQFGKESGGDSETIEVEGTRGT